jgi:hypothetical protein
MTDVTDRPEASASPPEDWVPVEHRVFGIDKRTIAPSLAVLVLAIVLAGVLPAISDKVDYDEPITAGDVIDLADGKLTVVPPVGWNRTAGRLVGETPAASVGSSSEVVIEDISVSIATGEFDGTADELLDQINKVNDKLDDPRGLGSAGERQEVTTESGLTGVAETFTGLDEKGITAAFVVEIDGTSVGVQVVVRGSVESIADHVDEIDDMLNSIQYQSDDDAAGAGS